MHEMASQLPLYVFGTLRRGEANHHYLAGNYERCITAVLPGYRRGVAAHGFPAAIPSPGDSVQGELFFLRESTYDTTLRHCDELEDILPGKMSGPYYRRAEVTVETPEGFQVAWAYVSP